MYALKYRGSYPESVAAELESLIATLQSWQARDHNEDGTHVDGVALSDTTIASPILIGPVHQAGQVTWADDGVTELALSAATNNLALEDGSPITTQVIRISLSADSTLSGIVPPNANTWWESRLVNASNSTLRLLHNSTASDAYARFGNPGSADVDVLSGGVCGLLYDPESGNWRLNRG